MNGLDVGRLEEHEPYAVEQYGPRRLWDGIETACRWWRACRPATDRQVRAHCRIGGQHVWLDSPANPVSFPTGMHNADDGRATELGNAGVANCYNESLRCDSGDEMRSKGSQAPVHP